ncbi:MAG: penicillin acylase family protein [Thermoanaerobaculales bacterium]|jgi:penicillin amidase|nr:penicillin acylase family protein [Thermoanaerobaculales bacterium]
MRLDRRRRRYRIDGRSFEAARTADGVARLWAEGPDGLACALGAAHAHDRLAQMVLARIVGQGRIAEILRDDETTLAVDLVMRGLGLHRQAEDEVASLGEAGRRFAEAYAAGVNHVLRTEGRPLELVLVRHRPEPWRPADTLLTVKLLSYLGLAQSQQDMEKLVIQAIHGGADPEAFRRLLAPHLDGLDDATVGLIRGLAYVAPLLPPALRLDPAAPRSVASNNWAVAGRRTASGATLQCNDPHLEVNRLPALWYEAEMHAPGSHQTGITMPGVPGLVMGRTTALSFGFTYGFMDMVDYFVEEIRGGACRRGDGFVPIETRREVVRRRGGPEVEITLRATDLGVVEADPLSAELADGLYLVRAWPGHRGGAAGSLEAIRRLPGARTVEEAQRLLRRVAISGNWVIADTDGHIGYQQSGLLPARRHSGLYPVPAWRDDLVWRDTVDPDLLLSFADPPEGFVATANDELNPPGGPLAVNLPMGPYRVERIRELLAARDDHDIASMMAIQNDLLSLQAVRIMELWRPLLPDTLAGRLLAGWDGRYDAGSRGATLFEAVYHAVLRRLFGRRLLSPEAWEALVDETAIVADFYHLFDAVLLDDDPFWWGETGREGVLRAVLEETLGEADPFDLMPWGRRRRVMMENIFFGGRLPRVLGFDHGPIELPGGRATIVQGGLFTAYGRLTSFAPSWRYIADLGADEVHTALAGGPSGRRFSRWYTTDVARWLRGGYKTIRHRS